MSLDQQPLYTSLNDLIDLVVDPNGDYDDLDCSIDLKVDNIEYKAYGVSLAYRDLLFYTDKGTIQYLVDSNGDRHTAVLHNVELD